MCLLLRPCGSLDSIWLVTTTLLEGRLLTHMDAPVRPYTKLLDSQLQELKGQAFPGEYCVFQIYLCFLCLAIVLYAAPLA